MKRKIELEELIVKENNQKRLDSYVTDKLSKVSRTTAQRLIEEEKILVNGKKQKASYKPEEGDVISIEIPEAKDVELKAQDIPVPVVYEDNDIIVVNKPKGMVVHPANGNPDGTLVNAILAMCKDSLSGIGGEIRPGIVHRLDKDTSGLLIVAKNDEAHMNMSKQIQERKVKNLFKSDMFLYVIGFIIMYLFTYIYNQIANHNMMDHAVVSEAVLTESYNIGKHYHYRYSYKVVSEEYEGSMPITKSVSIGDTIMIVYDQRKNKKSRAIRLRKGKAIISPGYREYVIVNNKTEDEKKEIADKLMAELKERYHVNE